MKIARTGNQNSLKHGYFKIITMTFLFLLLLTGTALAQPSIVLDNKPLSIDVEPVVENGRTLVPLRTILEPLGASVNWDGNTQTVTAQKGNKIVTLIIGDTSAYVDQKPVTLDVPGKIVNGRTMVPLRFVSESFGAKVQYDSSSGTIFISSDPNAPDYISYVNTTYGFTIMHPSDWEATENELGLIVLFMPPKDAVFNIVSEDLPGPMSLDFYVKLSIKHLEDSLLDVAILDSHATNIGSISAQTIEYTAKVNNTDIKGLATVFIQENKAYVLTYGGTPEEYNTYLDEAQTIASTFRFNN